MRAENAERAKDLVLWPVATAALSRLNLNLMRRGPTYYSKSHCLDLVDEALTVFSNASRT